MNSISIRSLALIAVALVAVGGLAGTAYAQAKGDRATPSNWNYEIKDGKRVPKANRVANADGSWREEVRQGSCVTIKQGSPNGEVKITRRCD